MRSVSSFRDAAMASRSQPAPLRPRCSRPIHAPWLEAELPAVRALCAHAIGHVGAGQPGIDDEGDVVAGLLEQRLDDVPLDDDVTESHHRARHELGFGERE